MNRSYECRAVPFTEMLGLLFLGLKLAGCIDWSWWWVLSPFVFSFIAYIDKEVKREARRRETE